MLSVDADKEVSKLGIRFEEVRHSKNSLNSEVKELQLYWAKSKHDEDLRPNAREATIANLISATAV